MTSDKVTRPSLDERLTGDELLRWYWLKEELVAFARTLHVPTSGGKQELTQRLVARLDGKPYDSPPPRQSPSRQLSGPIDRNTIVPKGQRCSQLLRQWFESEVGANFRFDSAMRSYFSAQDGTSTLGDALEHWNATRERGTTEIGEQFELNRFTRAWYARNPGGTRQALLEAWQQYRAAPVDARAEP